MNELRVTLVQADIEEENKEINLMRYGNILKTLDLETDLVVLPEVFATGFPLHPERAAETNSGHIISIVRLWANNLNAAICGSFLAQGDSGKIINRGFFITPNKKNAAAQHSPSFFYDKRHLFRIGDENTYFAAGDRKLIIPYKGWNIRLIICYDLRFPVWTRNPGNEYDLLICPANWPAARSEVWKILLQARALENQAYVCGVNRIGVGGAIRYQGDSLLLDFEAHSVVETEQGKTSVVTGVLQKDELDDFRQKFPVWMDGDKFFILS
ncbi:MAG: nitrilase family protein [Dysgonamonadaceae bacterium]|jgi:predicted amidohydrolase|nr:nitrilase family protein [Dysgonamonadaceae bacterium]